MTLQQLINKVLNDPAFFSALKKDPAKAYRPDAKGLSYGGAWTKMLGTGFLSLANIPVWPQDPRAPRYFLYYLFAACFLFDVFHIFLLRQARQSAAKSV